MNFDELREAVKDNALTSGLHRAPSVSECQVCGEAIGDTGRAMFAWGYNRDTDVCAMPCVAHKTIYGDDSVKPCLDLLKAYLWHHGFELFTAEYSAPSSYLQEIPNRYSKWTRDPLPVIASILASRVEGSS